MDEAYVIAMMRTVALYARGIRKTLSESDALFLRACDNLNTALREADGLLIIVESYQEALEKRTLFLEE